MQSRQFLIRISKYHCNDSAGFPSRYLISKGVATLDVCFKTGGSLKTGQPESTTILNELVLTRNAGYFQEGYMRCNKGCIEYFLENGADINFTNVSDRHLYYQNLFW